MGQVVWVPAIIDQDAGMCMERLSAIWQHARAFCRQRIERLGFRRCLAFSCGQTPIESAKGDTDAPGDQSRLRIGGYPDLSLSLSLSLIGFSVGVARVIRRRDCLIDFGAFRFLKAVKFKGDLIDLGLDTGEFGFNLGRVITIEARAQERR